MSSLDSDQSIEVLASGTLIGNEHTCIPLSGKAIHNQHQLLLKYREFRDGIDWSPKSTNMSYTPFVERVINLSKAAPGQHFSLVIMTDNVSQQTKRDLSTLAKSLDYPISIFIVGIGDGSDDAWSKLDRFVSNTRKIRPDECNISHSIFDITGKTGQKDLIDAGIGIFRHLPLQYQRMVKQGIIC